MESHATRILKLNGHTTQKTIKVNLYKWQKSDTKIAFDTDTPASPEDNSNMIAIIKRHNNSPSFLSAYNKAYQTQLEVLYKDFLSLRMAKVFDCDKS